MAATKEDVDRWIKTAIENGDRYVISVCDTFDWDDYPVYVPHGKNLSVERAKYDRVNMQKINEIFEIKKNGEYKRIE